MHLTNECKQFGNVLVSLTRSFRPVSTSQIVDKAFVNEIDYADIQGALEQLTWNDINFSSQNLNIASFFVMVSSNAFAYYLPAIILEILKENRKSESIAEGLIGRFIPSFMGSVKVPRFEELTSLLDVYQLRHLAEFLQCLVVDEPDLLDGFSDDEISQFRDYWRVSNFPLDA